MSKFYSNLAGREINTVPSGIVHSRDDLPDSAAIYTIHTVYIGDDGEPVVYAELTDDERVADPATLPKQVRVWVAMFDTLWNLLPEGDSI